MRNSPNYGVAMGIMPFFIASQFQTNTGGGGKGHSKALFDLAEAKSRQMNVDISFQKLHSLAIQRS